MEIGKLGIGSLERRDAGGSEVEEEIDHFVCGSVKAGIP
jgi:hypothetical protein